MAVVYRRGILFIDVGQHASSHEPRPLLQRPEVVEGRGWGAVAVLKHGGQIATDEDEVRSTL